ncbi:acyl-CoA thioesterase [Novipirellula artificiosorum]|uniref:Acyl-ACP thioesterase n=1 Tax=Novipirellula artificiosorum TaxID=2528016 RepID=A0A5C6E4P3_9BACT|nr:acyl-CoA thioesterase [Novipirellula artificiosorum]TWU42551.1 Acyl-ACP thioesterase [Novipirellula artificiosorum]
MQSFFDISHTVQSDEIDSQLHVHNLRYLQWTLWAASKHSADSGWISKLAAADGLGWVVRNHDITYRAAAVAEDQIVVRTWVSEIERYAALRKTIVCRPADQTVLARVKTRWVYVNLWEHRVVKIPENVRELMIVAPTPPMPWE